MVVIMECEKNSSDEEENCVRKRSITEIYDSCKPFTVPNGGGKQGRRRKIYEHILCKKCGEGYGEERLLLLCDGCDNGYHMYCLCPILVRIPKGKWFCPACSRKDGIREAKRRRRHNLCMYKKKQKLIPHVPSKDPEKRLRQMASLATALTSIRVDFCDELTYIPGLAPRSANRVEFEGAGMQFVQKLEEDGDMEH